VAGPRPVHVSLLFSKHAEYLSASDVDQTGFNFGESLGARMTALKNEIHRWNGRLFNNDSGEENATY